MKQKAVLILSAVLFPSIAALIFSFLVAPPEYGWPFAVTGGFLAAALGLVFWFSQETIIALSIKRRIVLLLALTFFVALSSIQFLNMRRTCIVRPSDTNRYPEATPVFFPLRLTGNAQTQEQRWRTRPDMLNGLSPNGVEALLRQMPDYERERQRTVWMLLSLLLATVTSVTCCAGVVIVLATRSFFPSETVDQRPPQKSNTDDHEPVRRFDVALSFPGEHRPYVKDIAHALATSLTMDKIFYDEFYEEELARPNLDTYLQRIYHDDSRLIVVFLCEDYDNKEWCGLELRAIRDLIKKRRDNDLMFVQVDDGEVEGLFSIDGKVDSRGRSADEIASLIIKRLRKRPASPPPSQKPVFLNDLRTATATGGFLADFPIAQHLMDACRDIRFLLPGPNYDFNTIAVTVKQAQWLYDEEQSTFRTLNVRVGFKFRAEATGMVCVILGQQIKRGDALEQLLVNLINESLPTDVTPLRPGESDIDRIYDIAVGETADLEPVAAITQILVSRYAPESS